MPRSKSAFEVKEIHDTRIGITLLVMRDLHPMMSVWAGKNSATPLTTVHYMYLEGPRPRNNFSNMDVRRCAEIWFLQASWGGIEYDLGGHEVASSGH